MLQLEQAQLPDLVTDLTRAPSEPGHLWLVLARCTDGVLND